MLKAATIGEKSVTFDMLVPVPERTKVLTYTREQISNRIRPATAASVDRYEKAWGLPPGGT